MQFLAGGICGLYPLITCIIYVQVGFGSGFKCNSAIWKALRPVKDVHPAWAHQANGGRRDPDFLVNSPDDDEN